MAYLNWFLRISLFILLLGLAIKNDQPVTLRYFFGFEWQSPLVVVLLIFFFAGTIIGVIAMFANVLKQRREIARLKRDFKLKSKLEDNSENQNPPIQSH